VSCFELADVLRIPEFTSDTKVLATPHQCIALARFGSGWDSSGVEVLLLAPCDPYQPAKAYKRIFPADHLWSDIGLAARGETPPTRAKSLVENAAVFDFGKIYQAVWLDLNVGGVNRSQKDL